MPYLKAEEKGIEFFEINCECFVSWGDYLQILLLYARTSRNADEKVRCTVNMEEVYPSSHT